MEDLEGWEVVPDDGLLEIHDDDGKKIFSRKFGVTNNVFKNYFICPSPESPQFVDSTAEHSRRVPTKQIVTVPIQLEPAVDYDHPDHEFLRNLIMAHPKPVEIGAANHKKTADQDPVSQVSFKKKKEPEFVEMKMDSPKSNSRGIKPQIDAGPFPFDDKAKDTLESKISSSSSPSENEEEKIIKTISIDPEVKKEVTWEENYSGGLNIWKWSMTGIGAICSFGVAAATVCIIVLGGRQKNTQHGDNQKLQFHIYTEDKRLKQVVHRATKLNEAISAARGVPLTRAHITFGGHYEGQ